MSETGPTFDDAPKYPVEPPSWLPAPPEPSQPVAPVDTAVSVMPGPGVGSPPPPNFPATAPVPVPTAPPAVPTAPSAVPEFPPTIVQPFYQPPEPTPPQNFALAAPLAPHPGSNTRRPRGRVLGAIGGLLGLGVFAPWVVVTSSQRSELLQAWDFDLDRGLDINFLSVHILGPVAVIGALLTMIHVALRRANPAPGVLMVLFGSALAAMAGWNIYRINDGLNVGGFGIDVYPGPGLILAVVGGVVIALAGFASLSTPGSLA